MYGIHPFLGRRLGVGIKFISYTSRLRHVSPLRYLVSCGHIGSVSPSAQALRSGAGGREGDTVTPFDTHAVLHVGVYDREGGSFPVNYLLRSPINVKVPSPPHRSSVKKGGVLLIR